MGKVKTTQIKRTSNKILRNNPEKFTKNIEENKKLLPEVAEIRSKKLRNVIAGYITRLVKKELWSYIGKKITRRREKWQKQKTTTQF